MNMFIFRLERLFQLRAKVEQQRAQELARAVRDEQDRRATLSAAAERLDRSRSQMGSGQIATAGTLRNLGLTVDAATRQVETAEGAHREALENVASEERQFGAARMDRRIVERLREKRHDAWEIESSRHEQKEMDGMSGQRHARKDPNP